MTAKEQIINLFRKNVKGKKQMSKDKTNITMEEKVIG